MVRHCITIPRTTLLIGGAMLLAACGAENAPANDGPPARTQSPVEPPAPPPAPPTDLTARQPSAPTPCPGMNLPRPPGSNCYGIMPSACAADRVSAFVGRIDSPALHREVAAIAGHANIRWIRPGEAVIENLDPGRLNVALSAAERIAGVDCY